MNENCLEMSALSVCKAADAITKLSRAQYSISVLSEEIINSSPQTVKDIVVVWECDKDGNAANEILEAVETLDVEYMVKKYTEEYGMI